MYVAATAMVCPVGLSAAASCAAKRAGISAFEDLPYRDNAGEPVAGAVVPSLDCALQRGPRLAELLAQTLAGLMKNARDTRWGEIPLLIGLAEPQRPGGGADQAAFILERTQKALGIAFHPRYSRTLANGHTAGFEGLRFARELLQGDGAPACVVCGVDSLVNASTLFWLDRHYRLKTPANRDGVIPGEAAAAVLVQKVPGQNAVTKIGGLGFGIEKTHILSEEPLLGLGLAQAARTALAEADVGLHQIDGRLSDATGELYGFKELSIAQARLMRVVRKQDQPLWHWSETIGDTGSAAGIAQLVLADEAFRKDYAPGDQLICFTSSTPGGRAAAVVKRRIA